MAALVSWLWVYVKRGDAEMKPHCYGCHRDFDPYHVLYTIPPEETEQDERFTLCWRCKQRYDEEVKE